MSIIDSLSLLALCVIGLWRFIWFLRRAERNEPPGEEHISHRDTKTG